MIDTGPYVLFRDDSEDRTTVFAEPLRVITAHTKAQFWSGLKDMETAPRARQMAGRFHEL